MSQSERRKANIAADKAAGQSVVISYCHRDDGISPQFHTCIVSMLMQDRWRAKPRIVDVHGLHSGPRIAHARNSLVNGFLATDAEWNLMLDSDMTFAPDVLDDYFSVVDIADVPVLGGLCFAQGHAGKVVPMLSRLKPADDGIMEMETIWDFPLGELVKVNVTGAACLMVHRSVYQMVRSAHNGQVFNETHSKPRADGSIYDYGEDVTFAIRAQALGIPIHVHTGIEIGHVKPQVLGKDDYLRYRRRITEIGEEEYEKEYVSKFGIRQAVKM